MRDEAAAKLHTQLGRICDAIEKRSIILARNDECSYSIAKVMDMLRSRPGIETGSELFWVATKLFLEKENREMFVVLKDHDLQIKWLLMMKYFLNIKSTILILFFVDFPVMGC